MGMEHTSYGGSVTTPSSSTDNAIVRWDGTTGQVIQDTTQFTVDDDGNTIIGDGSADVDVVIGGDTSTTSRATSLAIHGGDGTVNRALTFEVLNNGASSLTINSTSSADAFRVFTSSGIAMLTFDPQNIICSFSRNMRVLTSGGDETFSAENDGHIDLGHADGNAYTQVRNPLRKYTIAGITASTTQTQGQGALTADINEVSTVANANDTVTLPTAVAGKEVVIINNGANTLRIFPASGDDLGSGVDTATTLASGSSVRYTAYNATNWVNV